MNKKILYSLSLHIFIIWCVRVLYALLPYAYHVRQYGNYLWHEDGTPTTTWEYFLVITYYKSNLYPLLIQLFLFIPLVELNYWFVIRKRSLRNGIITSLLVGLVYGLVYSVFFASDFLNYALPTVLMSSGYAFVYGIVRHYFYQKSMQKELTSLQSIAELNVLKAQLNPHFLFNSMNQLYGSALNENAHLTAGAIMRMSNMMRHSITGMKENTVLLADELTFIENYISLQRERLPESKSIRIETIIPSDSGDKIIAPLLLLPFIENAFKYGISIDHPCFIKIVIGIKGDELTLEVSNQIIKKHATVKGNNTGIINTRKRLELLYEGKYSLRSENTGSEYNTVLTIKLTN